MSAAAEYLRRPLAERRAALPKREIMCRRCAAWTRHDGSIWRHLSDGSPACVDPDTLRPYADEADVPHGTPEIP